LLVGRIYKANAAPAGTPWMWTLLPFGYHEDRTPTQGYAGDACRRDGGARQGLAAGMTAAPAHEWFQVKGLIAARPTTHVRYRGHTGKHMLVLSFTGFDPLQTSTTLPMASSQVCPMGHIAKCSNPNCQNIPGRQLEDIRQLAADIRGGECRVWWA
jgi:hypothetical protein